MIINEYEIRNSVDKIDNGDIKITFPRPVKMNIYNFILLGTHRIKALVDQDQKLIGIQGKPNVVLSWIVGFEEISPSLKKEYKNLIQSMDVNWIYLDEKRIAIKNLEFLSSMLDSADRNKDTDLWPTIIIFMHNTLQAFMVWALTGSYMVRVLREKDAKKMSNWINTRNESEDVINYDELRLDSFLNLFNKIKDEKYMNIYNISVPFNSSSDYDEYIVLLNKYRNEFIHFTPKSWQIEISGFPEMLRSCIDIIEFLVQKSNTIFLPNELQNDKQEIINKHLEKCYFSIDRIEETLANLFNS